MPPQPDRLHLFARLRDGHLVQRFDRHAGVFATLFDLDHAPTGFEAFDDVLHHLARIRKFVIGVRAYRAQPARVDHDHDATVEVCVDEAAVEATVRRVGWRV